MYLEGNGSAVEIDREVIDVKNKKYLTFKEFCD